MSLSNSNGFHKPGFGWALDGLNDKNKIILENKVVVNDLTPLVMANDSNNATTQPQFSQHFVTWFPFSIGSYLAYPCSHSIQRIYNCDCFINERINLAKELKTNTHDDLLNCTKTTDDFDEFVTFGKSNNRDMIWTIMRISPNVSFKLHAHPNIEIIYPLYGSIYEYRRQVVIFNKFFLFSFIHYYTYILG